MQHVSCKIYDTTDETGKFVFPEIQSNKVDPNKLAMCISGGGNRSVTVGLGIMRALHKKNEHFMEKLSYVAGVSGGSWLLCMLTFVDKSLHELLGKSVPLHEITFERLIEENFGKDSQFIGKSCVDFPLMTLLSSAMRNGVPHHKCYQYMLAKLCLQRYGIDDMIVVENELNVHLNSKFNNLHNCIAPVEKRPFLICQSALMEEASIKTGTTSFEFTPMYSGCRVKQKDYGGMYFQNQGLGSYKTKVKMNDLNVVSVKPSSGDSCVESFMAASSAAYTFKAIQSSGSILFGLVESLAPAINLWSEHNDNDMVDLADGTFFDNTGIISLLARGCKKILSIVTSDGVANSICHTSIANFFGAESAESCEYSELTHKLQVFKKEDWHNVHKTISDRCKEKGPVYFRQKLQVQKNTFAGVNGNYEVELMVVYAERDKEFDTLLPNTLASGQVQDLGNYPTYSIFFMTPNSLVGMTQQQVNINSTYCDWYMSKIMSLEPDFFEELNA